MMKKRVLSIFISISLLIGLFPAITTTARATGTDITLSVQNDSSAASGYGPGYGAELTSGEAGSVSASPGIEIYFTDLSGSKAGVVNTQDLTQYGATGIGFFHARVADPTWIYGDGTSTKEMVIRKTDGTHFSFKELQMTFFCNVTLVIQGYDEGTPINSVQYTFTENVGTKTLTSSTLIPSIFQNVDMVTITGINYDASHGPLDNQLDSGVLFTKSVTVGDPILPDTAAPVLSAVSADNPTTGGASLHFTSTEAGTYYYLVYAAADPAPDAQTVKAQGTAVAAASAAGTNTASISGLTESTDYKAYVVVADAANNLSEVSGCSFTTSSKTVVSEATVTVTAPAKGVAPETTAVVPSDANYTVSSVAWSGAPTKFLGGTAYTANFTLAPKTDCKFTEGTTVTVSGTTVTKTLNDGTLTVQAAYPALASASLVSVAVKTPPTKTAYTYGDDFAPDGLVITQSFDDGTTPDVTYNDSTKSGFTFAPASLNAGTTSVTATYGGKSANIPITVSKQSVTAPTIESSTYTGEAQSATVTASGRYIVTANAGGTDAGDYDVVLTLTDPTNYKWSDSDAATKMLPFSITKATATSAMKTVATSVSNLGKTGATVTLPTLPTGAHYGPPAVGGPFTMTGMNISGTTLTYTAPPSTAGETGTMTIPVTGATNYNDYNIVVTVTSVSKTAVTVTGVTAASNLTYNGNPQLGYTGTVAVTDHSDLNSTLVYTYTSTDGAGYNSTTAPTAAGAYRLTVSVPESNETYTGSTSVDFTIAKKELNITGLTAVNRAYNGTTAITLTGGTLNGKIGSDDVSVVMPTDGTIEESGIGTIKEVTVNKPSLVGAATANYTLANLPVITVTITAAEITVTGNGTVAVTKAYDGTTAVGALSGVLAFSGKIGSEDIFISATPGVYAADAADVGNGKTVDLSLSLAGTAKGNYTLTSSTYSFTDATITKGTYSGSAISASVSVPVGDTSTGTAAVSSFLLPSSFKNATIVSVAEEADTSDILTLTGTGYSIAPTSDTQTATCSVVISSHNYADFTATLRFTSVNKLISSIAVKTAPTKTSYIVGNKFDPTGLVLTLTYDDNSTKDIAYNDTKSSFTFSPSLDTTLAKSNTAVTVTCGGKTAIQTINVGDKHKISLQWKDLYNQVYDGNAKYPTISATGVLIGDIVTVALSDASKVYKNAGSYTVTAMLSGTDVADYTIVNPTAVFTIQKAPVTVTISGDTVAKSGAISTTVTPSPNVAVTLSYRDSSGSTVMPSSSSAGIYDIYASISDPNYRFSDATDGTARKVGVLTIYETEPAKYAVTFSGGDGATGSVVALTEAQAGTIRTMPSNGFTKVNAKFVGWTYNGKTYRPGDTFVQPASDPVVTAVWQNLYTIGGTVIQDGNPVSGAVVTLMLGSEQIAQTSSGAGGSYGFPNVTPGLYNLVASKDGITQTSAVTITGSNVSNLTITMPSRKINTIVEVTAGTPDIVVGGLDDTLKPPTSNSKVYTTTDKAAVDAGGSVDVKLTASVNQDAANQLSINTSNVKAADVTIGVFLDFNITKTVKDSSENTLSSATIAETDDLLALTINIPAALQGAKNYVVYRLHGTEVQELRTTPNAAGEYIVINHNNTITVYAKYFSVYGLGYTTVLDITFDGNGGTSSVSTMTTATTGKLTSLPTAARSGYSFNGWYTEATGGTQITTNTTFAANTTVYAHWTANSSGGSSSGSSGSSGITYPITVPTTNSGTVKLSASSASSGTKVTVTITPDSGYQLDKLTVKDASGMSLITTKNSDGTYTFTMPNSKVTVTGTFEKSATTAGFPFTDVPKNNWARASVEWAYNNDIFNGTTATTFSPNLSTTRGMIATVLWRLEGESSVAAVSSFEDVASDKYYADATHWAAKNNIVKGYDRLRYGPEDDITREQLVAILYRYAQYKGYNVSVGKDTNILSYADANTTSEYAIPAMEWAVGAGLIEGSTNNSLMPTAHATRAQATAILQRFVQNVAK